MLYTLVCGMWYVVCSMWYVVCGMWYVVCVTYHIPHTKVYSIDRTWSWPVMLPRLVFFFSDSDRSIILFILRMSSIVLVKEDLALGNISARHALVSHHRIVSIDLASRTCFMNFTSGLTNSSSTVLVDSRESIRGLESVTMSTFNWLSPFSTV